MQQIYEEERATALALDAVRYDDDGLREFMVDHGFTEEFAPEDVTDEDLSWFHSEIEPALDEALAAPDFENWYQGRLQEELGDVATLDLVLDDIGFLSVLFLLLGVSTAYRLGLGAEA